MSRARRAAVAGRFDVVAQLGARGVAHGSWRLVRDIRAYVGEIYALVKGAGLEIVEGGGADDELK